MDGHAQEMPKKAYVRPSLEKREPLDEEVWGQMIIAPSGKLMI